MQALRFLAGYARKSLTSIDMTNKDDKISYPKGLRLNPDEITFIEGCLLGVAEGAKKDGDAKLFNMAMGLSQRVTQAEMAAEGVPPDLQKRLQTGLNRAVQSNKAELAQRALENYLATMVRLHPDPARALSVYVVGYVNQAVVSAIEPAQAESAREAATQILERYRIKIDALMSTYRDEGSWPESEDLLKYLADWNQAGMVALEDGGEPWEGDSHIAEAMAAEDE